MRQRIQDDIWTPLHRFEKKILEVSSDLSSFALELDEELTDREKIDLHKITEALRELYNKIITE